MAEAIRAEAGDTNNLARSRGMINVYASRHRQRRKESVVLLNPIPVMLAPAARISLSVSYYVYGCSSLPRPTDGRSEGGTTFCGRGEARKRDLPQARVPNNKWSTDQKRVSHVFWRISWALVSLFSFPDKKKKKKIPQRLPSTYAKRGSSALSRIAGDWNAPKRSTLPRREGVGEILRFLHL